MNIINDELLIKAKANSIGKNKKEIFKTKIKNIGRTTLAVLLSSLLVFSMCSCKITSIVQTDYDISYHAVDEYQTTVIYEIEKIYEMNGMQFYYDMEYSIEDYEKISHMFNEEDMIVYYTCMREEEFNKLLQALGYEDMTDFLIKNNYLDEKGNPSIAILRLSSYERMTKEVESKSK